ncbi:CidA/LrgA family protein [Glaciecola sp. MH2013]|uniref:CidA/LrgA family protein n=1 Tax=Glaciecola sp. MH2013 TaxID=2785524 RepID=UPI0018A0A3D4|nr:CidA/LrgA family protein [Glaciecola sp. MH2013]MBF7074843.1 CidA/LrgA family protein [Glaciecola sp. MH2013]
MLKLTFSFVVGFVILCAISLLSQFLFYHFSIPIPPALIGILLLLILLVLLKKVPRAISNAARPMLSHMALFLIPAMVSVLLYMEVFAEQALALLLAIVVSTALSLALTLWAGHKLLSRVERKLEDRANHGR